MAWCSVKAQGQLIYFQAHLILKQKIDKLCYICEYFVLINRDEWLSIRLEILKLPGTVSSFRHRLLRFLV